MTEATLRAVERAVIKKITKKTTLLATASRAARGRWKQRFFLTGASVATLTALSAGSASAQTWTGATSNDWTVGSNWSGGAAPIAGGTAFINSTANVVLGVTAGAAGTANTLRIGATTAGITTDLAIQNGATLTTTGTSTINVTAGSSSTVTVTGAGSRWNGATIQVSAAGTGTLNIENGATVVATSRVILATPLTAGAGFLNISGATLETSSIAISNTSSKANYDNATVRALANNAAFFGGTTNQENIAAGGLTFDTNGHNVTTLGLSGVGGFTKIGAGTFTFRAGSTFTGDTVIQQGTLALAGPAASVNDALANSNRVVANATFDISGIQGTGAHIQSLAGSSAGIVTLGAKDLIITNAHDTFAGAIGGTGGLQLTGGIETLSGANSYSGPTTVSGATLRAGAAGAFSAASAYTVNSGATLDLNGFDQNLASLDNAGTVRFGTLPGTTLTTSGNYTGSGGTLLFNTVLGGDSSATDRMVVQGNTSGTTSLRVTNVGGSGAQTVEGIKLIDVAGASNGTFSLLGNYAIQGQQAVVSGAYAYTLQKNGVSTPNDGDWYLRSSLIAPSSGAAASPAAGPLDQPPTAGPLYQPGVPLYESYAQVLLGLNALPTLQERVGDRYRGGIGTTTTGPSGDTTPSAFWGRIEGQHSDMQPQATAASTTSANQVKTQVGIDGLLSENDAGRLIVGITAQYGTVSANVSSSFGNGWIKADGYSVGSTLTWYGDNGFYVDGQAQATKYVSDLNSALVGALTSDNDGLGYAFSIESGKKIGLGNGWSITPQAQLTYSAVDFSSFADRFAAPVSLDNADSLLGRAGVQVNYQRSWRDADGQFTSSDIYGIANLHYEFLDGTTVMCPEPALPMPTTGCGAASAAAAHIAGTATSTRSMARSPTTRACRTSA